ncbi:TPA: transcriptional regulator/antitoxin, MazE [Candidatus Acetothermia bacterium]|nr:transcriptional regulator/antitoxin, MazE [Candidatus Acetothermia bacterium]HAZ30635.1 transcriptional regulator/antitoxin, MazE [Candidatus Acetothermia bacterium]
MITKVQKWGNSQGVRLSKEMLATADLKVGDPVEISARDGQILVTSARRVRGAQDLRKLVERIPSGYTVEEVGWGPPAGREVG